METTSLTELVDHHLLVAKQSPSGHSACTVYGGQCQVGPQPTPSPDTEPTTTLVVKCAA